MFRARRAIAGVLLLITFENCIYFESTYGVAPMRSRPFTFRTAAGIDTIHAASQRQPRQPATTQPPHNHRHNRSRAFRVSGLVFVARTHRAACSLSKLPRVPHGRTAAATAAAVSVCASRAISRHYQDTHAHAHIPSCGPVHLCHISRPSVHTCVRIEHQHTSHKFIHFAHIRRNQLLVVRTRDNCACI